MRLKAYEKQELSKDRENIKLNVTKREKQDILN